VQLLTTQHITALESLETFVKKHVMVCV